MSHGITGQETLTVLHVEDDPSFRDLTKTLLERVDSALSIEPEPSAASALKLLEERSVDCIISDYDMPGMDGLEFLKTVRVDYPSLPFILYTGKGSEEIAEEAINAGVDAYYQKEGTASQYAILAQQIATLVEKYTAERRLADLEQKKHLTSGGLCEDKQPEKSGHADSVSMAVVQAVAAREGVDPVELTPLAEAINPEALNALFPPQSDKAQQRAESVTFTYHGYTISVANDGQVTLDT